MECWWKKGHQHNQNGDEDKEKDEQIGHVLDIPADDRLDKYPCAIEQPDDYQCDKFWLKEFDCLSWSLLFNYSGKKGNWKKKKSESHGVHGKFLKHLKVWQALKEQLKAVLLYLTEKQEVEDAIKAGNRYGTETENGRNQVYPDADTAECHSGIWDLGGQYGRDKLRSCGKRDDKKSCFVTFGRKLYKKIGDGQGEPNHGHEVHRRIVYHVPLNGGKKSEVDHVGQDSQDEDGLFIFFCKPGILEKMGTIKKRRDQVEKWNKLIEDKQREIIV